MPSTFIAFASSTGRRAASAFCTSAGRRLAKADFRTGLSEELASLFAVALGSGLGFGDALAGEVGAESASLGAARRGAAAGRGTQGVSGDGGSYSGFGVAAGLGGGRLGMNRLTHFEPDKLRAIAGLVGREPGPSVSRGGDGGERSTWGGRSFAIESGESSGLGGDELSGGPVGGGGENGDSCWDSLVVAEQQGMWSARTFELRRAKWAARQAAPRTARGGSPAKVQRTRSRRIQ